MTNPIIRIHDAESGEVLDREMTANELKDYETSQALTQSQLAEAASTTSARLALLERLGITAEEAVLLLG